MKRNEDLTTEEKKPKKRPALWVLILEQILLTGLVLCLFAAFHHVLPRWRQMKTGAVQPIGTVQRQEPSASPAPAEESVPEQTAAEAPAGEEQLDGEGSAEAEQSEEEQPDREEELPESWQLRYSEYFSDAPTWTENAYSSPNLSVTVTEYKHTEVYPELTYFVADIYIADISSFIVGFAEYSTYDSAERIAQSYNGIVAINSDEMLVQESGGLLIRNGDIYSDTDNGGDLCVLYYDGRMETYRQGSYTPEEILAQEPLHSWQFGPALLDEEGKPLEEFNISPELQSIHPRTALGYYEPGHYCFVVIDGRQPPYSKGAEMGELAEIMSGLGCRRAYNLDGGASSMIIFHGKTISSPLKTGLKQRNRNLNDMLIITEPNQEDAG